MADESGDDNVVALDPRRPNLTPKPANRDHFCRHRKVEVGEHDRSLNCQACGASLDPTSVLIEYAREERHFAFQNKQLQRQKEELEKQVEELKAEERRIKARVRRWRAKDGDR